MKSKFYLFIGLGMMTLSAGAQKLTTDYITWPDGQVLGSDITNWEPGKQLFEDENFFISRVKIKPYIERNALTQVLENITEANDKKSLLWVPVGNTNRDGVHTDALPNSLFDSEVFSCWSYVTHYGDWTSPYGWVPAGFADAAHKHGTAVSGVASVPNATIPATWANAFNSVTSVDVNKVAQFLWYHGVDGLGYNSEWYSGGQTLQDKINNMHSGIVKWMADKNPKFENIWYSGVEDGGTTNGFYDGLYGSNSKTFGDKDNVRVSLFLNYNWNSDSKITTSQSTANQLGRNMQDLYAGMNMQGGCKTSTEWDRLSKINYSLGMWGAHDFNYFWSARSAEGGSDDAKQEYYQKYTEWWFSNGARNPIIKLPFRNNGNLAPSATFQGYSRLMAERSSLGWDLATEPFITYFNLGNGKFFNWAGERQNDNGFYSIGIQDYMPTWRWWFTKKFLGKAESDVVANGLDAKFTWNDAWLGGSCLNIFGSTETEYLHLFKTAFTFETEDVITVRYKIIGGKADITLALSDTNSPIREDLLLITKAEDCVSDDEAWIEKKFTVSRQLGSALRGKKIAVVGLKFENAENLDLYLGEISFKRGSYATPAAPQITLAKPLAFNYSGVDAKVIFNMENAKEANGEPCYNLDVNTSMFRIWAQQEDAEPVNMGATTSWAAIVYSAPVDPAKPSKIRFGVQAVGLDFESASEIAWSEYMDCGEYKTVNDIQVNKSTICTDEKFVLSFVDPKHDAANWSVISKGGATVCSGNGTSLEASVSEIGMYDVKVGDVVYADYLNITSWEKGALPEIQSLSINGSSDAPVSIDVNEEFTLAYTGRESNGLTSQGLAINEKFVGFPVSQTGLVNSRSYAVGCWIKFQGSTVGSRLWACDNRALNSWPRNNWGSIWGNFTEDGNYEIVFRTSDKEIKYVFEDYPLLNNQWTHLMFSCEYNESNEFRLISYFNGKQMRPTEIRYDNVAVSTVNLDNPNTWWISRGSLFITDGEWMYFGGGAGSEPVYNNGVVDDLVLYSSAISQADVDMAYAGLDPENLPSNVACFWSFEDAPNSNHEFMSIGSKPNIPASDFATIVPPGAAEGQATQTPQLPTLTSGAPSLEGNFKIEATPTWKVRRATITEQNGTDTEGSAKLSIDREGTYTANLTLANTLGSHSVDYPVLTIGQTPNAIEGIEAGNDIEVYTVEDALIVSVAEAGEYNVQVYNIAGQLVAQRNANVSEGAAITIGVHQAGVYMVNIMSDGKVVRTAKVIKK